MATQIFLGYPPENIKKWIIDHYSPIPPPTPTGQTLRYYNDSTTASPIDVVGTLRASNLGIAFEDWNGIVENLESFSDSMIGTELPAVGSFLSSAYEIGDNMTIPLTWQVLGYNSSIPKYVKYKDENGNKIYVSSMKPASNGDVQGELLSAITVGDAVYVKNSEGEYESNGQTVGSVDGSFTYGQTNATWGTTATESGSYSVPSSITVSGTTYSFAGYNMTLATRGTIGVVKDSIYYNHADFFAPYAYYINDWSGSQIRAWLNGNNDVDLSQQMWKYYDNGYNEQASTTGNVLPKFTTRFGADNGFLDNVVQVVNRTWVWGTDTWNTLWNKKVFDSNKCEHVSDKFWLLGFGHINGNTTSIGTSYWTQDFNFDTVRYSNVFGSATSISGRNERIRYQMNPDGSISLVARRWRLRSANSNTNNYSSSLGVGYVSSSGYVNSSYAYIAGFGALLPACTIG